MNLIAKGLEWLTVKLAESASVNCSLLSAHSTAIPLRATFGKVQVQVPEANGAVLVLEVVTAIVPAADLAGYTPRNGDWLIGTGVDYEVAAPGHGTASWAWLDAYRTRVRLYLRERHVERATG
jgi:hypothetical protein